MQVNLLTERNILAYFKSPEEAQHAARKLQSLRVIDMSIDRFNTSSSGGLNITNHPLAGDFHSYMSMTHNASFVSVSEAILSSSDPAVSGMSDGGADDTTGRDILLTVVLEQAMYAQAERIIEESGGMM